MVNLCSGIKQSQLCLCYARQYGIFSVEVVYIVCQPLHKRYNYYCEKARKDPLFSKTLLE